MANTPMIDVEPDLPDEVPTAVEVPRRPPPHRLQAVRIATGIAKDWAALSDWIAALAAAAKVPPDAKYRCVTKEHGLSVFSLLIERLAVEVILDVPRDVAEQDFANYALEAGRRICAAVDQAWARQQNGPAGGDARVVSVRGVEPGFQVEQ
jgi:hypothetical protein